MAQKGGPPDDPVWSEPAPRGSGLILGPVRGVAAAGWWHSSDCSSLWQRQLWWSSDRANLVATRVVLHWADPHGSRRNPRWIDLGRKPVRWLPCVGLRIRRCGWIWVVGPNRGHSVPNESHGLSGPGLRIPEPQSARRAGEGPLVGRVPPPSGPRHSMVDHPPRFIWSRDLRSQMVGRLGQM